MRLSALLDPSPEAYVELTAAICICRSRHHLACPKAFSFRLGKKNYYTYVVEISCAPTILTLHCARTSPP